MRTEGWIEQDEKGGEIFLRAGGEWRVAEAPTLDALVGAIVVPQVRRLRVDLSQVAALDTVGAWLLVRLQHDLAERGTMVVLEGLPAVFVPLFDQVERHPCVERRSPPRHQPGLLDALAYVGEKTLEVIVVARDLLGFLGLLTVSALRSLRHPKRVRLVSLIAQVQRTGVSAVPIVGLLSFLIGVVFAYQGADQLRRFGAEIFAVNLLGITFLRELGVMMTAIIIAGRSGSAFTAELGAMQVNEEIDALRTLGLDPIEVLVLPRLFALVLALPLIAFYANFMGLLGGALMSWAVLAIPPPVFLQQLRDAIVGWTFWIGIIKAPFFAVSIALTGCHEGLGVSGSAESVGRNTTRSVVHSIFLVIVLDALFSVLFSWLRI